MGVLSLLLLLFHRLSGWQVLLSFFVTMTLHFVIYFVMLFMVSDAYETSTINITKFYKFKSTQRSFRHEVPYLDATISWIGKVNPFNAFYYR